jgi:hypothetical protein
MLAQVLAGEPDESHSSHDMTIDDTLRNTPDGTFVQETADVPA